MSRKLPVAAEAAIVAVLCGFTIWAVWEATRPLTSAPAEPAEVIDPPVPPDLGSPANEGPTVAQELMSAAVELHEAKQELRETKEEATRAERRLEDLDSVVVFMSCLEEQLGRKVDGDDLERHIRRDSRQAQICKRRLQSMTREQKRDLVESLVRIKEKTQ